MKEQFALKLFNSTVIMYTIRACFIW